MIKSFIPAIEVKKDRNAIYSGMPGRPSVPVVIVDTGDLFFSSREAGVFLGVDESVLSRAASGKLKYAKGYTVRYATKEEVEMAVSISKGTKK